MWRSDTSSELNMLQARRGSVASQLLTKTRSRLSVHVGTRTRTRNRLSVHSSHAYIAKGGSQVDEMCLMFYVVETGSQQSTRDMRWLDMYLCICTSFPVPMLVKWIKLVFGYRIVIVPKKKYLFVQKKLYKSIATIIVSQSLNLSLLIFI